MIFGADERYLPAIRDLKRKQLPQPVPKRETPVRLARMHFDEGRLVHDEEVVVLGDD